MPAEDRNTSKKRLRKISAAAEKSTKPTVTEKKSARELMEILLDCKIKDADERQILKSFGFTDSSMNRKAMFIISLFNLAQNGNAKAIDTVLTLIDEKPSDNKTFDFLSDLTVDIKIKDD